MENHSISNISRVLDLKVVSVSLFVISNNSGLLIQSNRCDRTKYLCGLPCVVLTVERESNPTVVGFMLLLPCVLCQNTPNFPKTAGRRVPPFALGFAALLTHLIPLAMPVCFLFIFRQVLPPCHHTVARCHVTARNYNSLHKVNTNILTIRLPEDALNVSINCSLVSWKI